MKQAARLRELLKQDGIILLPGAYDALVAKLIEQAGFPAVYMTGSGTAAGLLGLPDVGLITMTEMVMNARYIVNAVRLPVICDADTGYGNAVNVIRTVQEFERAGVAGIHIEDQEFPKKCGHMEGKRVIPIKEMAGKIRAAVEAREDRDFVIIARTDARAVLGVEEVIRRAEACLAAGADLILPEAPQSVEEMEYFGRMIPAPLIANMAEGGKTPILTAAELAQMGYKVALFANSALRVAHKAIAELLAELAATGTQKGQMAKMKERREQYELLGLDEVNAIQVKYGV